MEGCSTGFTSSDSEVLQPGSCREDGGSPYYFGSRRRTGCCSAIAAVGTLARQRPVGFGQRPLTCNLASNGSFPFLCYGSPVPWAVIRRSRRQCVLMKEYVN